MKKILFILIFLSGSVMFSCKESLTEVPKDFASPENSFTNKAGFDAALAHIYLSIRNQMYIGDGDIWSSYDMLGADVDLGDLKVSNTVYDEGFFWNTLNFDSGFANKWWSRYYNWIFQANTIIGRAEQPTAKWASDAEKNAIIGEAKFLRAFAYHFLANMWGGVPIVVEETKGPKFDYARATQDEVYKLCKSDLEYAVQYMPTINTVKGGKASKEAANHLLSEVKICLKDYQGAIDAATAVIGSTNMALMTARFGPWKSFTFNGYDYKGPYTPWGDVYFDLFQDGNFNWKEGNKESIWNIQQDLKILGGGNDVNTAGGLFGMERWWGPIHWNIKDSKGVTNFLKDTVQGRPVGKIILSGYADSLIWKFKGDWNKDIRNSEYNIQRVYYWVNPASSFYGMPITAANMGTPTTSTTSVSPQFKKFVSAVHYHQFQDVTSKQWHDNGRTYKDWYMMRLAETYLLRAEANLLKNDKQKAADDINVIRGRAMATPVLAGEVTLDLILDERARELYGEEFRVSTLMRMGKLTEYLNKYNGAIKQKGYTIADYKNKMPIPRSEIEANKEAVLEQNPGY
jgi:hypothetical protein